MRFVLTLLLLLSLTAGLRAADVEFVRVWPEWREAKSFERISEYFTGQENPGSQVICRTHAETRAGFYFLARVNHTGATAVAAKIVLSVIKPDSPKTVAYTFPVTLPSGETVFNLGLTGADWPGLKIHPVAWKIEVVASDGRVLGAHQSYLWEKPQ